MTASGCVMTSDVFYVCLTHAMSTEQEEVMGLLIGDVSGALVFVCVVFFSRLTITSD